MRKHFIFSNTNSKESNPIKKTEQSKKGIKNLFSFINKFNVGEKTQIALAICSIVSIIVFICVSIHQSSQTREALNLARQNYIEENRPYVFTNIPTMQPIHFGNKLVAHLPIVNYGHTPAYGVNYIIKFQHSNKILDPRTLPYDSLYTRILSPNSIDTMKVQQDGEHWDSSSTARYYLVGKIWYKDGWSDRLHYTTFVYEWIYLHESFLRHNEYETADRIE
jgi:hypothetical protein